MSGVSRSSVAEMAKKGRAALDAAGAALGNELLTRQRVDAIESVLRRGFLGRLRWIFLGR